MRWQLMREEKGTIGWKAHTKPQKQQVYICVGRWIRRGVDEQGQGMLPRPGMSM